MKFSSSFLRRLSVTLAFSATLGSAHADPIRYQPVVENLETKTLNYDVAVYGGTPAGVTAAVQAARDGKSAVLISFNNFVGGMTSGGLTATDLGDKKSIGGMAFEFYQRVGNLKGFRPSKAESIYREMLKTAGVTLLLSRPLISAKVEETRITSIKLQSNETIQARMFIDATYEGDLLAAANVSYQVGREPASTYNESLGGQWQQVSWKDVYQFCRLPVSPFKKPSDPSSGLLPEIAAKPAGKPGQGDFKVQAYNFRTQISKAANRAPFPRPTNYDPTQFALLARFIHSKPEVRWTLNYTTKPMTDGPVQLRSGDSNNAGSFSTDYVGGNYHWPDGTYASGSIDKAAPDRRGLPVSLPELYKIREKIFQDHIKYQQGLYYFLANDPQVPESLRKRVNEFGLDPREFPETGHWPHQLYIREGRRMVSDYVMTQDDCERERIAKDSVGLASYPMDSHFCQRVVVEENGNTTVRNEGGFGHHCKNGPYPISYRSIVPKKDECTNLLVPVSLSSSHVAFGSIRMEPVFMILGQSAGTAASLAIDQNVAVQELDYETLKAKLIEGKQHL